MNDNDLIRRGNVRKLADTIDTEDGEIRVIDLDDIDDTPAVPQEMSAREYLKTCKRMCTYFHSTGENCAPCPLRSYCGHVPRNRNEWDAVAATEQWAKNHPEKRGKTYAEDFLEKFPKARRNPTGEPCACRVNVYGVGLCESFENDDCEACWNEEMEELE